MENEFYGSSYLSETDKTCDIIAANLLKYYHRPIKSIFQSTDVIDETGDKQEFILKDTFENVDFDKSAKFINKGIQTDYRESEAQTDPWDPPYTVIKINKEPDVLDLKKFSYGKGLPVTMLEVDYINQTNLNKNLIEELKIIENEDAFERKKEIMCSQIKTNWNYKLAVEKQMQLRKLEEMNSSIFDELNKNSKKREHILKNMWNKKREELNKKSIKLKGKLTKEMKGVETLLCLKQKNDEESAFSKKTYTCSNATKRNLSKEPVDILLDHDHLNNFEGLSTVKNWLEKKQTVLKNEISLSKLMKKTQRDQLVEEAYQNILSKNRTKLPPKVYYEEYEREEIPLPTPKPEHVTEYLKPEEKKLDMITVLQQILRGLAYQKQMLKLIEKHKEGLTLSLKGKILE